MALRPSAAGAQPPEYPGLEPGAQIQDVLNDKQISKKVGDAACYLLGERNQVRRIRDLPAVLARYAELGTTGWSSLALLAKVLLLALNVTAIFFAWITYKADHKKEWQYELPLRFVVWLEFLGICFYLLLFLYRTLRFLVAVIQELRGPDAKTSLYLRNLEVCSRLRIWYKSGLKLDFNLFRFVRYVSPQAVGASLERMRHRVYGRFGTRIHRDNCCVDLICCCCFYGRLMCCSVLVYAMVLLCAAVSLMLVLLKIFQLRFLGSVNIHNWSITELLLFGQFVVNLVCLDMREKQRRKAKLELLYDGTDAEEAVGERKAKSLVDNLAMLIVRYHFSLWTALAQYHSLTADDISWLYIHDQVEEDKPRNHVRHEKHQPRKPKPPKGGGAAPVMSSYDNPEWVAQHPYPGYPPPRAQHDGPPYHGSPHDHPLYPGEVLVQIAPSPRRRAPQVHDPAQRSPVPGPADLPPGGAGRAASPGAMPPPGPPGAYDGTGRFPWSYYDAGYAVGAHVPGYGAPPNLKSKYEQTLWGAQAS